jgi:hypothetical protein
MLNMPKGVKKPWFNKGRYGCMDGGICWQCCVLWNSGDSLVGKPAIDKYGEIEELTFWKLSLLRMKFGYHKSK